MCLYEEKAAGTEDASRIDSSIFLAGNSRPSEFASVANCHLVAGISNYFKKTRLAVNNWA